MAYYTSNSSNGLRATNGLTLDQLYQKLNCFAWCKETAYQNEWDDNLHCKNQCNATALLVQSLFGGDIIQYPNPIQNIKMHYFNRIGSLDIDLTSEQYVQSLNYQSQTQKATPISLNRYQKEFKLLKERVEKKTKYKAKVRVKRLSVTFDTTSLPNQKAVEFDFLDYEMICNTPVYHLFCLDQTPEKPIIAKQCPKLFENIDDAFFAFLSQHSTETFILIFEVDPSIEVLPPLQSKIIGLDLIYG